MGKPPEFSHRLFRLINSTLSTRNLIKYSVHGHGQPGPNQDFWESTSFHMSSLYYFWVLVGGSVLDAVAVQMKNRVFFMVTPPLPEANLTSSLGAFWKKVKALLFKNGFTLIGSG